MAAARIVSASEVRRQAPPSPKQMRFHQAAQTLRSLVYHLLESVCATRRSANYPLC
jgi:hypothetical protein